MDAICWAIICAMGTAIGGLATFIKMLWTSLQECQRARVKALQDQISLVRTTSEELETPPKNGGAP